MDYGWLSCCSCVLAGFPCIISINAFAGAEVEGEKKAGGQAHRQDLLIFGIAGQQETREDQSFPKALPAPAPVQR